MERRGRWVRLVEGAGCVGALLLSSAIGTPVSADARMSKPLPPRTLSQVLPSTEIIVRLRDGTARKCRLVGSGRDADADYAHRYAEWRDALPPGGWAPRLGDSTVVTYPDGRQMRGTFQGFNYRGIEFHAAGDSTARLVAYGNFAALEVAPFETMAADSLDRLDAAGRLPSLATVRFEAGRRTWTLPVDQVVSVRIPQTVLEELSASSTGGSVLAGTAEAIGIGVGVYLAGLAAIGFVVWLFTGGFARK